MKDLVFSLILLFLGLVLAVTFISNVVDPVNLEFENIETTAKTLTATKAEAKAIIEAPSFSMGAMLPCVADSVEMQPFSFLMCHDYSGGMQGKGSEMREQIKGFDTLVLKMLDSCVKHGILTEQDKFNIKDGKDVYIHPENLK